MPLLDRAFAALVVLLACAVGSALPGCGPSELRVALDAYRTRVRPLLEKEDAVWRRISDLLQELDDDPRGPRYFAYLERTAAPFYATLRSALDEAAPPPGPLADAHRDLLAFADLRKEFLRIEGDRRFLLEKDVSRALREADIRAGAAFAEYETAVGNDVPDPRYGELRMVVAHLADRVLPPLYDGSGDVEAATAEIRKSVLPKLRELRDSRYADDPGSKALRLAVVLTEERWQLGVESLPDQMALTRASLRVKAAVDEADAALRRWRDRLDAIERSE
jgi:hypothetical protein